MSDCYDAELGRRALPQTELVFQLLTKPDPLTETSKGILGLNALPDLNSTLSPSQASLEADAEW